MFKKKIEINHHLFYETSHSPSLVDIVGEKMLHKVIDFCFIENPYYPGKGLLRKLTRKLPVVIKSYPSSNPILAQKDLAEVINIDPEHYLLGICDLTGELVRKAINNAIKGDTKPAFEIKDFVEELYNELMLFDFRGGELRKKFDSIKYDLGKLDQLAFDITVKK